ncbi:MAG: hypothetical protein DCC65_07285 [Planctomycetota bacterium]|nr:MAG: hypothetical protein DCC65_07285 [Planctomycetota bacterium]
MTFRCAVCTAFLILTLASIAAAEPFYLLTGVDVGKYPGTRRNVAPSPGPGFANGFDDGDRLAGTSDTGGDVVYVGIGSPVYPPNHVGAMSFLFRRATVPSFGFFIPLMGIDYLGGPLLDLDGDNGNGTRSLIPVSGQNHVEIPGSSSFIDLTINIAGGTVTLNDFDASGTAEGAPGFDGRIAVTLITIAGTTPTGGKTGAINPSIDTRLGTLTPFSGGGALTGVYRVENLGYELWYDSISPDTGTPDDLGTLQHLGTFRGWLVQRDCATGLFPTLAGQGLGSTQWPTIDQSQIGLTHNTAINVFGTTATIAKGSSPDNFATGDDYTVGDNGLACADFGGDIGAYLDNVVVPHLDANAGAFVYLEGAGFGINNSGDPVFSDTIGYDVVMVAQSVAPAQIVGDIDGSGAIDFDDAEAMADVLLDATPPSGCDAARADINGDDAVDALDVQGLVNELIQG